MCQEEGVRAALFSADQGQSPVIFGHFFLRLAWFKWELKGHHGSFGGSDFVLFDFVRNIYPYFDPSNALDPGTTDRCTRSLKTALCFTDDTCNLPATVSRMRKRPGEKGRGEHMWVCVSIFLEEFHPF